MGKIPLSLTIVISFYLLNVATADPMTDCIALSEGSQYRNQFCQESCNLYGLGCAYLGNLYAKGPFGARWIRAVDYYKKACELNVGTACLAAGNYLRYEVYETEKITEGKRNSSPPLYPHFKEAMTYYEKACALNEGYVDAWNLDIIRIID